MLWLALIFSLGFMQPNLNVLGYPLPFTDLLFLATFSVWLFAVASGRIEFRGNSLFLVLIPFLSAMVLSTAFSPAPSTSLVKLSGGLYLIGLGFLAVNLVQTEEAARRTILAWLAAATIAGLVAIVTGVLFYLDRDNPLLRFTLSHYGTLPVGNYPRVKGTFLNANMLCNYFNVALVLLYAAKTLGWIGLKVFAALAIILLAATFLTVSPGIGGVLLSSGLLAWVGLKKMGRARLALASALIGVFAATIFFFSLLIAPAPNHFAEYKIDLTSELTVYSSERFSAWLAASRTIAEKPFLGSGYGMVAVKVDSTLPSGQRHSILDAHQTWLNFGAQTGLFGLAAIVFLSVFLLRRSLPLSTDGASKTVLRVSLGVAFIGAFLFQGLGGSFEDARHLWVLIGLLAGVSEWQR